MNLTNTSRSADTSPVRNKNYGGQSLDVLFVYPSYGDEATRDRLLPSRVSDDIPNQESPNIGIGYLLAVAKKAGVRAKFIDMMFDDFSAQDLIGFVEANRPTLVGFTAFTTHIKAAGYLADKIRSASPKTKICVGGPHASAIPLTTLEEFPAFDFVVCGEAENILIPILDSLDNDAALCKIKGVVVRGSTSVTWSQTDDLDAIPFPVWEDFELSRYGGLYPHRTARELPMVAQRGCPYRCNFCMRASGDTVRTRAISSVIAEIEHNIEAFGCESIAFLDETFALNKKWTETFFAALKKRGLNKKISWACSMRVSHTTPDLFQAMREAGCYYTFFGLESADPAILQTVGKKITVEDMKRSIVWAKEAGIIPVGAFIIGLPNDTEKNVFKAIDLGKALNLYSITFPIAVPFPGTELRQLAEAKKCGMRILSNDWDRYGKQEGGVLESEDMRWSRRKELQQIAYQHHPKKELATYIETFLGPHSPLTLDIKRDTPRAQIERAQHRLGRSLETRSSTSAQNGSMNERREIPATFDSGPSLRGAGGDESLPTSITLLMPTLNEIEGLKRVLPNLDRTLFDDILVVDGGSTDGTVEYARERGLRIERQRRLGLAAAVFDAIKALKTTHVVEFSPDGNSLADRLPELVSRLREGYDIVTVSRYLGPAKSYDDTPVTAFGNYLFTRLIRVLGDFPVTDALVMFRGFRCDIVRLPEFERALVGPVFEPLVTAIGLVNGMRMSEIPGDEPERIGGRSKLSVPYNGACILLMIVRLYLLRAFGGVRK